MRGYTNFNQVDLLSIPETVVRLQTTGAVCSNSRNKPFKRTKIPNLLAKCCKIRKYSHAKFANFVIIVLRAEIVTIFEPKVVTISARHTVQ